MAGQTTQTESDFGFSLPHLFWTLGLVAGMGIFVLLPSPSEPELPSKTAAKPQTAKAETPKPVFADATGDPSTKARRSLKGLRPAVAQRRSVPAKFVPPRLVAAIAEKPPVESSGKPLALELELQTEHDLQSSLANLVPTVGLDLKQAAVVLREIQFGRESPEEPGKPDQAVLSLLDEATRNSLPFQDESNCKLDEGHAKDLRIYSQRLHAKIGDVDRKNRTTSRGGSAFGQTQRDAALASHLSEDQECQEHDAIPALLQILQVEAAPVREKLIAILAKHQTQDASQALANRAVFDLSPVVRQYANMALADRPAAEFRPELLEALRYPWSPAAWHAAETLVAVKDARAVPELIALLDAPDPTRPFPDLSGTMKVRELVRVNHFQNCLLCHAASQSRRTTLTTVAGAVPTPGQPINQQVYYSGSSNVFVRADVTYLRQDFSAMHYVEYSKEWPELQRFDYFVRTREATDDEIAAVEDVPAEKPHQYPQRDAVLYALRKLTGKDAGQRSEDWRAMTN
jgi:hypothetical protein